MQPKKTPIIDVYFAKIPPVDGKGTLYPAQRQAELSSCSHTRVRRQKYYVWKLLEYALWQSLALDIRSLEFSKTKNGKWTVQDCCFSLSHSHNVVAVAISGGEIGVDVERIDETREEVLQKTLTETERLEYEKIPPFLRLEYLFCRWTQKESFFKRAGDGSFRPAKISVDKDCVRSEKVTVDGEEYMLSVSSENAVNARYFLEVDLTE